MEQESNRALVWPFLERAHGTRVVLARVYVRDQQGVETAIHGSWLEFVFAQIVREESGVASPRSPQRSET